MEAVSLLCQLFLVIASATPGCSLFADLTASHEIVCRNGETVSYDCIVSTLEVQWIVEPFIPASGPGALTIANVSGTVGNTVSRTGMVVEHVSLNPFLTRLRINSSVINSSVSVTCSTLGLDPERANTLEYIFDDGSEVEDVSGLIVTPIGFTDGGILVQFTPSPSRDIANYTINCTNSICRQTMIGGTEDDIIVEATSGGTVRVCVFAVNRCGRESEGSCSVVEIPPTSTTDSTTISTTTMISTTVTSMVSSMTSSMTSARVSLSTFYGAVIPLSVVVVIVIIIIIVVLAVLICVIVKVKKPQKPVAPDETVKFNEDDGVNLSEEEKP